MGSQLRSGPWNSRIPRTPHAHAPSPSSRAGLPWTPLLPPQPIKRTQQRAVPRAHCARCSRPEAEPVTKPPMPKPSREGMEPTQRRRWRRRSCSPLVSAFLRDPGSGRVYKRGKLIGKVGTNSGPRVRGERARAGRGARAIVNSKEPACVPAFVSACVACPREFGGWHGGTPGSLRYGLCGAHCMAGTSVRRVVLCRWSYVQGVGVRLNV